MPAVPSSWDVATGKELLRKQVEQANLGHVLRLSPSGEHILMGSANTAGRLLRVKDGKWTDLDPETSFIHSAEFSPDSTLLATGAIDGMARLWDTATGKLVQALPGHPGYILSLTFSADGRTLAAGSWRSVRLWEVPGGRRARSRTGSDVFGMAFSPDGQVLACGCGDSTILLWDVTTGARPRRRSRAGGGRPDG
jgi:WD40 repeat protein